MPNTLLFYIIFISQIGLISYYYPKKIVAKMNLIINNFPPENYPKLYPESLEKVNAIQRNYLRFNFIFLFIGIALLSYFGVFAPENTSDNYFEGLPLMYGMLQFSPMIYLELLGSKQLKLMRNTDNRTNRKADLQSRRLFNYISPLLLGAAIFMYFTFLISVLALNNFIFTENIIINIVTLTAVNILFIVIAIINLSGKKRDPYQASTDRDTQIKSSLHSLAFVSIFVSIFIIIHTLTNRYEMNYLEIIINSLYFQILAVFGLGNLIRNFKIEETNFDVYKAN